MTDYPDLYLLHAANAAREQTLLTIATIAFAAFVWLWLARFEFPITFSAVRAALIAAFCCSLILFLVR